MRELYEPSATAPIMGIFTGKFKLFYLPKTENKR
jgi:hypothetical protein